MSELADILSSKSRAEIFRLLFAQAGTELYLRNLQRQTGLSMWPIQKEMSHLEAKGLVKARKDGNRVYYSANTDHPLFPEIRSLVEKTVGIRALLQKALTDSDIEFAFVFGSVAAGTAKPGSDLDLFIIGKLGPRKLIGLLRGYADRLGRVINPHVIPIEEFRKKVHSKDHFISAVMSSKKMFLIGEEDELNRLGKE